MKQLLDMRVAECAHLSDAYALLKLRPCHGDLPGGILPGQFAQVLVPDCGTTILRRPISVNFVDYSCNELWLLVRNAGQCTERLTQAAAGAVFSVVLPLGHPFSIPRVTDGIIALVGGGVGVAPLLYLGKELSIRGMRPHFALGARSAADLLELDEFEKYGTVHISTEDGTAGEKGLITSNSLFDVHIGHIACCGPTPMMKAVAKIAKHRGINCEVSLENMMACGIGACLCCVEDTTEGHVCVCTDGPVFNINQLKWEI